MQENFALNWIFFSVMLGELTETSAYVINSIILLGKRFIFETAGVDSILKVNI